MDLRHLRYFVVTADQLNFSKASKMLYISQPGLSKNINELERLLGVELFDRSAGKLSLTQAGEYLLREAKKLISDADRIEKEVRIIDSSNKRLCTIAIEDKVAAAWGDEDIYAVRSLKEKYPLWTIRICSTNIDEISTQLKEKRVDFGIVMHHEIGQMNFPHLRLLGHDRMGMVCHKDNFSGDNTDYEAIKAFWSRSSLYYSDHSAYIRAHCRKICQEQNLVIKDTQVAESNIAKLITTLQDGAFLMPYRLSQKELTDDLIFIEFPGDAASLGVYAVWNDDEKQRLIDDFCSFFREASGEE